MTAVFAARSDPGTGLGGPGLLLSLIGILFIAVLAGRLLGARRSLLTNLAAGVVGWLVGVGVSTLIAGSQPNPRAGFARNVWVFSVVFTMSAMVWWELLARPGALARAQSGFVNVPRPIRALRRRARRIARYAQITRIAARHGLGGAIGLSSTADGAAEGDQRPAPTAIRLRRALEEAGGVFVKLGQVLSTRSDLLPVTVCRELERLQDEVPPDPAESLRAVLEDELGTNLDAVFAEFDWTPIAAASIGHAYLARLTSGEAVVVKVQRPGIAEAMQRDIEVMEELARLIEDRTGWGREYRVRELADEFAERLREELDFTTEARNATEIGRDLDPGSPIRVPRVYRELTSRRVLVMEWLDGVSVRADPPISQQDRESLADALLTAVLRQVLIHGCFHADPHPGNVLVLTDGALGLIDFGAVGRLDPLQQAALRDLLLGVGLRDPQLIREAVMQVAEVRRDLDEMALERALARFTARRLGAGATPSASMLVELLELCFTFGLTVPPELTTVFRALGTVEGTLRVLAPGYLAIQAVQRIVVGWTSERRRPAAVKDLALDELGRVLPLLRRLPSHVERLASQAERGQLHVRTSLFTREADQRFVSQLANRFLLAFLGAMVGVLSVLLLGTPGGPVFSGTTSLFQFFGYFGLFCATVLILRVLVAVLNDRTF